MQKMQEENVTDIKVTIETALEPPPLGTALSERRWLEELRLKQEKEVLRAY
jgi:hypothetical protein